MFEYCAFKSYCADIKDTFYLYYPTLIYLFFFFNEVKHLNVLLFIEFSTLKFYEFLSLLWTFLMLENKIL